MPGPLRRPVCRPYPCRLPERRTGACRPLG
ncbi:MAG: hypothetical protein DMD64_01515 [Gemmatimonadetes bacterium]|nr:MAG: hypothetical protein DMD64_01515 [Gemmatimonadota bacterium]